MVKKYKYYYVLLLMVIELAQVVLDLWRELVYKNMDDNSYVAYLVIVPFSGACALNQCEMRQIFKCYEKGRPCHILKNLILRM
jgi:hypothetical protein